MTFSQQLAVALSEAELSPVTDSGLIVKLLRLRHDAHPGRSASGVLPLVVVGHQSMEDRVWRRWVRENGIPHYGAAITERMVDGGIDLREMAPTAAFGRQMRDYRKNVRTFSNFSYLDRAEQILTAVEKWPSLYNIVATEMAEQEMTLDQFVGRIMQLPPPRELGAGAYTTLGDLLLPPGGMVLPGPVF